MSLDEVSELTPEQIDALLAEPGPTGTYLGHSEIPQYNPNPDLILVEPATTVIDPNVGQHRYFAPLADAADDFVYQARTVKERVFTGIDTFDQAMRGLGPKELMVVNGYAHSGKTLFTTHMMRENKDRRVVLFTPDESRVLTLVKLVSLEHGVSAIELEWKLANGDETAEQLIRDTANRDYPNLAVFDEIDDLHTMTAALDEVEDHWNAQAELVIFDYLDLLSNGPVDAGGDTKTKIKALKSWAKKRSLRLVVLHQSSRTSGADGAEQTISSGAFGGEAEATYVIGVRRKRDYWRAIIRDLEERKRTQTNPSNRLDEMLTDAKWELNRHQDTVTFNLVKNKRPPSVLVDEADFTLDKDTGRISPFEGAFTTTSTLGTAAKALLRSQEMF